MIHGANKESVIDYDVRGLRAFSSMREAMMKPSPQVFRKSNLDQFDGRLLRMELKLADLQRSNWRLKAIIGALVFVGGALITMAQASSINL